MAISTQVVNPANHHPAACRIPRGHKALRCRMRTSSSPCERRRRDYPVFPKIVSAHRPHRPARSRRHPNEITFKIDIRRQCRPLDGRGTWINPPRSIPASSGWRHTCQDHDVDRAGRAEHESRSVDYLSRRLQDLNLLQLVQPARHIAQRSHLELAPTPNGRSICQSSTRSA